MMNTNKYQQSVRASFNHGVVAGGGANGAAHPTASKLSGAGSCTAVAGVTASTANAPIMPGKKLTLDVQQNGTCVCVCVLSLIHI